MSLSGFGRPVFLSRCTFCACYRPFFVIAIESFLPFVATPPGTGGRPFVSFCTTLFFVILHTIGLYIRSLLSSLAVMKRLAVVLFGFLASLGFSPVIEYTTNNYLNESLSSIAHLVG